MTITAMASITINDVGMSWDESTRRVEKPCVVCSKLTRGRIKTGGIRPACISCAITQTFDLARKIYGPSEDAR